MLQLDYSQQCILVVGGTSGINRGVAESFAAQGAKVAVISRSQDKVDATIDALKSCGAAAALGAAADVREFPSLQHAVDQLATQMGGIDTVISGAAGNFPALATSMSANGFKSVVDIDLLGSFHVAQAIYPHLRRPGGNLIHISAPQAQMAMVGQAHVCAAKAGVDMLTRTLALEWGCEGIRVNSVIPGPIEDTEGTKRLLPTEEMRRACEQSIPLKRLGVKQDIANACLLLASPLASYISGAVLPVDGGWLQGGFSAAGAAMEPMLRSMAKGAS